jgi:hypothetical protein
MAVRLPRLGTRASVHGARRSSLINGNAVNLNNGFACVCMRHPFAREFGSGVRGIEVLHVARCNLLELDGITMFHSLAQLHAPGNHLFDLEPLGKTIAPIAVLDLDRCERIDLSSPPSIL